MAAPAAGAPAGGDVAANGAQEEESGGFFSGGMMRTMVQMFLFTTVVNMFSKGQVQQNTAVEVIPGQESSAALAAAAGPKSLSNLYGAAEDCDLIVHYSLSREAPSVFAVLNTTLAAEEGYELLWHHGVWYEASADSAVKNVSIGPLPVEALSVGGTPPYIHVTLLRTKVLEAAKLGEGIPREQVVQASLPLTQELRELDADAGAVSLFGGDEDAAGREAPRNMTRPKVPYLKTKLDIRPVFDQTVLSQASGSQGPFRKIKKFPALGIYQPYLYVSDFWLLEKDYLPLNASLAGRTLNLTLTYSIASLFTWSVQAQMAEQWMVQGEWGITDTQRDSFMLKRLYLDTNPYFLAFSACFMILHTVFSMLAFKHEIQFWRNNQSMQGLSARSMIVSFVCQLITALYLLDSQETSRLILFEIVLDTGLAFWKLRKAVKVELKPSFPFVSLGGQEGYENAGTDKYDEEAIRYMMACITPLFLGYALRSSIYGKHRGWYSFLVSTAAGGVYTFGFVMMTPQLYINYKLKSVEHLPWRALSYKAMNTFVDDIAAFLIDMPVMHRLACFRDDIVFFIYIYQRWKYSVDKTRPSIWAEAEADKASAELPAGAEVTDGELPTVTDGEPMAAEEPAAAAKKGGLRERKK